VKAKHPQEYKEREEEWGKELEVLKNTLVKKIKLGNEHATLTVCQILTTFSLL
jgi:hypothetical protein